MEENDLNHFWYSKMFDGGLALKDRFQGAPEIPTSTHVFPLLAEDATCGISASKRSLSSSPSYSANVCRRRLKIGPTAKSSSRSWPAPQGSWTSWNL